MMARSGVTPIKSIIIIIKASEASDDQTPHQAAGVSARCNVLLATVVLVVRTRLVVAI